LAKGDQRGAEALFRQVLAANPRDAAALGGLGVIAARTGHLEPAVRLFAQAREQAPSDPDHGINLGSALWGLKRRAEALAAFEAAVAAAPGNRRALYALASALVDAGRADEGRAQAEALVAQDPKSADAHALLGRAWLRSGRPDQAIACLREATRLAPTQSAHWNDLGLALSATGEEDAALDALRRAVDLAADGPRTIETTLNLAGALIACQRADEAEALLRPLYKAHPDHPALPLTLGDAIQRQGRFDESRALFQAALDRDPDSVIALRGLTKSGRIKAGDPVIDRLRAAGANPKVPDGARVEALYALGKALDDSGDADSAFTALSEAKALQSRAHPYDPQTMDDLVARSEAVFTPDLFTTMAPLGTADERPVFIVGMPRSGTSLVEQMLASHPRAAGAGELAHFKIFQGRLPDLLGREEPFPLCIPGLTAQVMRPFADRFLGDLTEAANKVGKADALRVSDKMPDNALRLGLIALAFPKARVIVCRRDPMDTGLSIYQQNFSGGVPYANDLTAIGRAMIAHDRIMAHWRTVLPLPMLEVDYETLVNDLEGQGRRLMAFLDLDWDPAVLRFHETERPVYTASKWQVRQPVFASSVGRWLPYADHLAPLRTILEEAGLSDQAV